jgi:hypothetical protein
MDLKRVESWHVFENLRIWELRVGTEIDLALCFMMVMYYNGNAGCTAYAGNNARYAGWVASAATGAVALVASGRRIWAEVCLAALPFSTAILLLLPFPTGR